jgi:arginine repressor
MPGMKQHGKSHAKELVRATTGRDVEELLRDLYVVQRLTQAEIGAALEAKGVSVHRMTISLWLREYGITRDDRPAVAL